MSNVWGKAIDQSNILKASFNDLERTAIKATRHKLRIPKEKHVRKLIIYTHERLGPIGDLYTNLLKRMEQPDWIIVLKTLIVFHRVLAGGNVRFLEDLTHRGNVFPLSRFTDMTSTQAHQQSVFIRRYSSYLEEKVFAFREMRQEFDKDTFTSKGLSIEQLLNRIPKMQRQFDALLSTHVEEVCDNIITINAFELLLKDSFKMYCNLNDAVLNILELYFNMTKRDATKALDIYKVFMRETDAIIEFFSSSRRKFHIDLPELSRAPSTVVQGLEEYLRDLEDDGLPPHPVSVYNGNKTSSNNGRISSQGGSSFNSSGNYNFNNNSNSNGNSMTNSGGRSNSNNNNNSNSNNFNSNNNNNNNSKRNDELISFDDDLFSTPPPQQPIQQQSIQQQQQQYKPPQSFELDPFHVTNIPPQQQPQQIQMQPLVGFNNNNNNSNNSNIAGPVNPSNYNNPFDPAYNEKALQIKAAFQSSQGENGAITNRNSLNLNDLSFGNNNNVLQPNNNNNLAIQPMGNNNNGMSNMNNNGMGMGMNNGMSMNNGMPMNNGMGMNNGINRMPMNNNNGMMVGPNVNGGLNNGMGMNNGMNNGMTMNNSIGINMGMNVSNGMNNNMNKRVNAPTSGLNNMPVGMPTNNNMSNVTNNSMGMPMGMGLNGGSGIPMGMNNGMGMGMNSGSMGMNSMGMPMGVNMNGNGMSMNNGMGMGMNNGMNNNGMGMGMGMGMNNGMSMNNNGMGMRQPMNQGHPNQQQSQQNQQVQNIYF